MSGLKYCGKTTILVQSQLKPIINIDHGMGFYSRKVMYNGYELRMWNSGDIFKSFSNDLWQLHRNKNTKALIWVVDSANIDKLNESYQELHDILSYPELANICVLILANKQDLLNSLCIKHIQQRIGMIQYGKITYSLLKRIQCKHSNTFLNHLPDDIIEAVAEYLLYDRIRPSKMKKVMENDINIKFLQNETGKYNICQVICSMLPPYDYIKGAQTKCAIFGCSAITPSGFQDGFNWLKHTLSETDDKDCKIL